MSERELHRGPSPTLLSLSFLLRRTDKEKHELKNLLIIFFIRLLDLLPCTLSSIYHTSHLSICVPICNLSIYLSIHDLCICLSLFRLWIYVSIYRLFSMCWSMYIWEYIQQRYMANIIDLLYISVCM
ncbi:hypothetical protein CSUI_003831 [Cystoisospora suis]|uniref:Transmembrane protein n=1 Tax=Cystoisospora suis TaxID=483139 RepID=A0A2C6KE80_9APIC|nr:hypothetical protein CSUI_003831 [Cystoisospora suis]